MISVIVPVHNTFPYIKECIDSILNQTYYNLEIICIDSSTDGTTNILKEMEAGNSRIRVIVDSNSSYGYKVNVGIRQARGEYIGIVDSDDYLELNMYERLLNALLENKADFVKSDYSSFCVQNDENDILEYHEIAFDSELYGKCFDCRKNADNLYKTGISIWTGLYKKDFLLENNIFLNESEGASFQDAGFSVLTHVYGRRIYYLHESFYRYRTDNANSSVKSQKKYRTVADEWNYIDTQIINRGITEDDLISALRMRKIVNYEWNFERLDEETSKEFAKSVNDELEMQYIDTDFVGNMSCKFKDMFEKVYLNGLSKIPKKTQKVIDLIRNQRVALVGMGELGRKIVSYDIGNKYFGIQKLYGETETIEKINGFYIPVEKINDKMLRNNCIYIVIDEGQDTNLFQYLESMGVTSEKIYKCSSFYYPEKLVKEEKDIQRLEEKDIKVSIIVSVLNDGQYLEECLESLINQITIEYEIICVIDGIAGESIAILESIKKSNPRIRIVTQINRNRGDLRNIGIQQAQGKYILFCDCDDMLKANSIDRLYSLAEESQSEIICYDAKCVYMTEKLKEEDETDAHDQRGFSYGLNSGKDLFTRMMEDNNFCDSACLLFINRKWLEENNIRFYDGILYEDCLFSVQCLMKAQRVYHINEEFYIYRKYKESSIMNPHVSASRLYCQLINLHVFNKLLLTEKLTERQEWALAELVRSIRYYTQNLASGLDELETEKLLQMPLTCSMKLELEQCGGDRERIRNSILKAKLKRMLESAEGVEIYGAGVRGQRFLIYLYLNGYGHKVRNFVVSTKGDQPSQIGGIDVFAVDESWKVCEENLLVITFAGGEAKELAEEYKNKGTTNLLYLDVDINNWIISDLKKKLKL